MASAWAWRSRFLLEMRDSSLKTERDVEFALHFPVLAMIPEIEPLSLKRKTDAEDPALAEVGDGREPEVLRIYVPEIFWASRKPVQR